MRFLSVPPRAPLSILFGSHELDLDRRLLLHGSEELHVSRKAFELLRMLVERAPVALSKNEIHDLIWPGTFVSETALAGLIAELRSALHDDAHEPHVIRTVHGFGYSCIAPIRSPAQTAPASPSSTAGRFRLLLLGREVSLAAGENVVGRDALAMVYIEDASVSRRHALLHIDSDTARLEDLGSKNGTFVNGTPLHGSVSLDNGDVVAIGVVQAVFRETASASPTVTVRKAASGERKAIKFRRR